MKSNHPALSSLGFRSFEAANHSAWGRDLLLHFEADHVEEVAEQNQVVAVRQSHQLTGQRRHVGGHLLGRVKSLGHRLRPCCAWGCRG